MKITQSNIKDYINFLFKKTNNVEAPVEIVDSWTRLNNDEIQVHLKNLYQHWNLDTDKATALENEFSMASLINAATIPSNPVYSNTASTPNPTTIPTPQPAATVVNNANTPMSNTKGKSYTGIIIGSMIAVIALAYVAYVKMSGDATPTTTNVPTTNTVTASTPEEQPKTMQTKVVVDTTQPTQPAPPAQGIEEFVSGSDEKNAQVIERLYEAESNQDMRSILNTYSKNMQKYWGLSNPTEADLIALYAKSWSQRNDIKHENITIEKVGNNQYDVSAIYSAYNYEKKESIRKPVKIRFEFDKNNKIIKTYGL